MLNYAVEYGEYCDACQTAVTVIRSSDAALKFCMEWLTMSYVIGDSAYLTFSAVLLGANRAIVQKWVPYSQRYLFNAIPDTNHNANSTNPNRYSKGNPTLPVRCRLQYH